MSSGSGWSSTAASLSDTNKDHRQSPEASVAGCVSCANATLSIRDKAGNTTTYPWCRAERNAERNTSCCTLKSLTLLHQNPDTLSKWNNCYPLSWSSFQRSFVLDGGSRMRRFIHMVASGRNVTIVTIGGSVALGHGTNPSNRYKKATHGGAHDRFISWLRQYYHPGRHISYWNLAKAGSSSFFAVANLAGLIGDTSPDLVLWDYTTNDLLDAGQHYQATLLALTERLARALLRLPSKPAIIFLSLPRSYSALVTRKDADMQAHAFAPICRAYGLALVSYRDAIAHADKSVEQLSSSHLYDIRFRFHPIWYVTQLIADCMAYAWMRIEANLDTSYSEAADHISELPNATFSSGWPQASALEPCSNGWRSDHSPKAFAGFTPYAVDGELSAAWSYIDGEKPGWEFNASRSSSPFSAVTMEPISFEVEFGEQPKLVLSYLRSYENFGRAIFWIREHNTSSRLPMRVMQDLRAQEMFRFGCDQLVHNSGCWKPEAVEHCSGQHVGIHCNFHRTGDLADPWIIDGYWDDQSSQAYAAGFEHGYTRHSEPIQTMFRPHPSSVMILNTTAPLVAGRGKRIVSIAFLRHQPGESFNASRSGDGGPCKMWDVHSRGGCVGSYPSPRTHAGHSSRPATRFKLLGIMAC